MTTNTRRAPVRRGDVVYIAYGKLQERDPNYGVPVNCYVCATPHKGLGLARIEDKTSTTDVPLCEPCLQAVHDGDLHTEKAVIRKHWNAPDLEVSEGGAATTEQLLAVADKQGMTEH